MAADSHPPNTKYAMLKVEVPRDPSQYRRSDHCRQRQQYRSDPTPKTWILEECIEEGHVSGVDEITTVDIGEDNIGCFAFDKRVWSEGEHDWRVIVALKRSAFLDPEQTHRIVTAYCPCHSDDEEDCS